MHDIEASLTEAERRAVDNAEKAYDDHEDEIWEILIKAVEKSKRRGISDNGKKEIKPFWFKIENERKETDSDGDLLCYVVSFKRNNKEYPLFYSYDKYFIAFCVTMYANHFEEDIDDDLIDTIYFQKVKAKKFLKDEKLANLSLKNFYSK